MDLIEKLTPEEISSVCDIFAKGGVFTPKSQFDVLCQGLNRLAFVMCCKALKKLASKWA